MEETKLKKVIDILSAVMKTGSGWFGIYDTRNCVGDSTEILYRDSSVTIYYCDEYDYFEVFGLSNEEFDELRIFYDELSDELINSNSL